MRRPSEVIVASLRSQRAEIHQQLFGSSEGSWIGRFEPAEAPDFFDAARLQGEHDFGEVEPFHFGQFLRRPVEMFALGPKPQAMARRRPTRAASALIRRSAADFLDQQRVDSAPRIEPGDPGQPAVDHDPHAVDRERSFGHVRGDTIALRFW